MLFLDTDAIKTFNAVAKHGPLPKHCTTPEEIDQAELAISLICEECKELHDALYGGEADEDRFKEMLDVLWVIFSYCMRRGWDLEEGFRRLGESNLSKFNKTTQDKEVVYWAEYFPSGKVKKSLNYKPVDLKDLVQ